MSRINTNVGSLIAVNALNKNNASEQTSLQRLSTGFRINSGKDDPSGLIASESLQAEQKATETAIGNAQQANNIIATAEGSLSEVSNLLISLQGLVGDSANSAGLSTDEQNANQLQVDSILSTVNRISNSSSFQGVKLLDGTFGYATSGLATNSAFTAVSINSAKVTTGTLAVTVAVITSAQTGELDFAGSSVGLANGTTLTITGNQGTAQVPLGSAVKSSSIVTSINLYTDSTGVKATLSSDNKSVRLNTVGYGSSQFVTVTSSDPAAFATTNRVGNKVNNTTGVNATLTVNGTTATSDGLNVKAVFGDLLDVDFTLNQSANKAGVIKTFGVTGGGATFSLGAQVNTANTASIGIGSINTGSIGTTVSNGSIYSLADLGSGKAAAVNTGNTTLAQNIVNKAIEDVSNLRGRLGAFQSNTLSSTINSLNVALENVSSSESAITDTDFATETANLTRSQILVQSATSVLKTANSAPQAVLSLLS
jgi:flagellin